MNRRKLFLSIGIVALVALAGCENQTSSPSGDELAEDVGESVSNTTVGESYAFEIRMTEKNQYGLVQAHPPFVMESSLERMNLIRRYKYLNDRNNVHHVYLMSHDGKVVAYEVAQGKVSSVNSKLTNDMQIVASRQCLKEVHRGADGADDEAGCFKAVESPQMDGSYGTNGDAIFFFTPSGHYVEWNGLYLVSEEPKGIQTALTLVDDVDEGNETATNSTSG